MTAQRDTLRRTMFPVAAAALACGALLAFASLYQSPDSLSYATRIRDGGAGLFHPHHLLFSPAIRLLYLLSEAIGISADAILLGQLHNLLWLFAALLALFRIAEKESWRMGERALFVALFVLLNGVLAYATQVEVYVPAMSAGIVACALLWRQPRMRMSRVAAIVLFSSLAVLYHQVMIVAVAGIALSFFFSDNTRRIGPFLLGVTLLFSLGYAAGYAYESAQGETQGFTAFVLGYLRHPNPAWGTVQNMGAAGIKHLAVGQLQMLALVPKPLIGAAWRGLLCCWLLLGVVSLRSMYRHREGRAERCVLFVWFAGQALVFLWWLPAEAEFHVLLLPPLLLLSVMALRARPVKLMRYAPRAANGVLILAVSAFALMNLPAVHARAVDRGDWYRHALSVARAVGDVDRIYTDPATGSVLGYRLGRRNDRQVEVLQLWFLAGNTDALRPYAKQPGTYAIAADDILPAFLPRKSPQERRIARAWLRWLFAVRPGPDGTLVFRRSRVVRADDGTALLRFDAAADTSRDAAHIVSPLSAYPLHDELADLLRSAQHGE